jgi:hypothetical protein
MMSTDISHRNSRLVLHFRKPLFPSLTLSLGNRFCFLPVSPPSTTASIILQSVYYNISCASENEHEEQELILVKSLTLYWK